MAAVSLLKFPGSGSAPQGHAPTADDIQFNSLGAGVAATGVAGEVKASVRFLSGDGTLAAPAFGFTTETNTGLRLAAAGDLRAVVAGADAATFGSTLLTFLIGGSERMRLDSAGTLIVNPGATPTDGFFLNIAQPTVAGTRDSHMLVMRGTSYDTVGHNAEWRQLVDVTTNAGASTWLFQSRIDAATFGTRFSVEDSGLVTVAGRITGVAAPTAANDALAANEQVGWLSNNSATPQGTADTVARYTWADGSGTVQTTEADFELRAPYPCVIDNLHIDATSGPTGAGLIFTLRKAGVNTALAAAVVVGATQATNTTDSATYTLGEKIAMMVQGAVNIATFGSGYRFTMRVRRL